MFKYLALPAALLSTAMVPAEAQTSQRDLEVIGRVMGFLQGPTSDERVIAIAHAPDSQAEAEAIAALLDGGLSTGRVTLTGRLVDSSDTGALSGAHAVILVGSTLQNQALRDAASSSGVLTVSTDTDCANSGACMLGVASSPSVRIVVNRANLDAAGINFDAAFVLMVEEV